MEDWERAFSAKSERRRLRSERKRLIRRGALLALVIAIIALAIWAIKRLVLDYIVRG